MPAGPGWWCDRRTDRAAALQCGCCRSRFSARFSQSNPHRLSWIHPPLLSVCPCISYPSSSQIALRGQPPTSVRTPRNHLQSAFNSNRPLTGDATSGRIRPTPVTGSFRLNVRSTRIADTQCCSRQRSLHAVCRRCRSRPGHPSYDPFRTMRVKHIGKPRATRTALLPTLATDTELERAGRGRY